MSESSLASVTRTGRHPSSRCRAPHVGDRAEPLAGFTNVLAFRCSLIESIPDERLDRTGPIAGRSSKHMAPNEAKTFLNLSVARILPHDQEGGERKASTAWTLALPQGTMVATADCERRHGHCGLAAEPGPREV
jgi:hypothetical protein